MALRTRNWLTLNEIRGRTLHVDDTDAATVCITIEKPSHDRGLAEITREDAARLARSITQARNAEPGPVDEFTSIHGDLVAVLRIPDSITAIALTGQDDWAAGASFTDSDAQRIAAALVAASRGH